MLLNKSLALLEGLWSIWQGNSTIMMLSLFWRARGLTELRSPMLAFVLSKYPYWILYHSNKLLILSNILAAVDASVLSSEFMSKNFVVIQLKLTSNVRTVTRYIFWKPVFLLSSNIILKGDWVILSFSSSKKWSPMQLAIAAIFVLSQVKFLPARLSENYFLIKKAKWSMILKNVLYYIINITDSTVAVILGFPDIDPTFRFFANKWSIPIFPKKKVISFLNKMLTSIFIFNTEKRLNI